MSDEYISKKEVLILIGCMPINPTAEEMDELYENVKMIDAADVRPVVLCRECDHWNEWDHVGRESLGNFRCSCAYWSNEDGLTYYTSENDFCSYGERREDT